MFKHNYRYVSTRLKALGPIQKQKLGQNNGNTVLDFWLGGSIEYSKDVGKIQDCWTFWQHFLKVIQAQM